MSSLTNEEDVEIAASFRNKGNLCAQELEFEEALWFYNRSLCIASEDNESLALAYAGRSAVSFECNEFEACLRNIKLAIDHNYPENEIEVLIERRYKCLKLMETNLNRGNQWEFLKLSYQANNKVPFIVDCLELNTNEVYGRHVITNKDLKVGDIVAIEKPFSIVVKGANVGLCSTCGTRKLFDVIPCTTHFGHMYCSEACKELAMKTFHRTESEIMSENYGEIAMRMYMNALVLFNGSIEDLRDFLCSNQSPPRTIFDFDFNNPDEIENDKNRLLGVFALMDDVEFMDKDIDQFATYFLECALKISTKYTTSSLNESFHGLYLFGSLLNRSHTPNFAVLQFDTKRLYLVIRPILKGEQLFTSNRPCISDDCNGTCKGCEHAEELRKTSSDLILHEPPKWPDTTWKSLDRYSTVKFAIERFKNYCTMLQSSPDLLNNYNGVLITEYIITCLYKVIWNKPLSA